MGDLDLYTYFGRYLCLYIHFLAIRMSIEAARRDLSIGTINREIGSLHTEIFPFLSISGHPKSVTRFLNAIFWMILCSRSITKILTLVSRDFMYMQIDTHLNHGNIIIVRSLSKFAFPRTLLIEVIII